MLDAGRDTGACRDPECRCAVVITPVGLRGRVVARLKSTVGVKAGCENQVGIRHELKAAGDSVAKQYCACHIAAVKNVVPFVIQQTAMKVHAVACLILHGLGHEARDRSKSFRDGTYTPLHANDLIAVQKRVIGVSDVDFVLSRCRLFQDSLKG